MLFTRPVRQGRYLLLAYRIWWASATCASVPLLTHSAAAVGMAQLLATDTIIYVRICAMYSNKRLHRTLISLLFAATLGSAAIAGAVGSRTKGIQRRSTIPICTRIATETPYVGARQCTVTTPYGFLWAFWYGAA